MERQTPTTQSGQPRHSLSDLERCAEVCFECYRICAKTVQTCLTKGGMHADAEHVSLLLDCARICELSGDFLTRGSLRHQHTCEACAAVCEACAADCRKMSDDEEMARCAEVCTRCAESCRHMSAH